LEQKQIPSEHLSHYASILGQGANIGGSDFLSRIAPEKKLKKYNEFDLDQKSMAHSRNERMQWFMDQTGGQDVDRDKALKYAKKKEMDFEFNEMPYGLSNKRGD